MSKFSVKKPFTVLVAVIMVLVLGFVSFTGMRTELLPDISLPYLIVVTTYPGASPEKVESDLSEPLESALGTVNGVETVTSTSAENYSMVMLEFEDDTNMDSAMVKVSSQLDQIESSLPELASTPIIMEVSMDMMATMYVSVDYEGKDIYELSDFVDEEIKPYFERESGVASVSSTGMVEKTVQVSLNQSKIDLVNDKVLMKTNDKLKEAYDKLLDSQNQLDDGYDDLAEAEQELTEKKAELEDGKKELEEQQSETTEQLAALSQQIDENVAKIASTETRITTLEGIVKTYQGMVEINKNLPGVLQLLAGLDPQYGEISASLPQSLADALANSGAKLKVLQDSVTRTKAVLDQLQTGIDQLEQQATALQKKIEDPTTPAEDLPTLQAQLEAVQAQLTELKAKTAAFETYGGISGVKTMLDKFVSGIVTIQALGMDCSNPEEKLAENQNELTLLTKSKAELDSGLTKLRDAYKQLESGKITAAAGFGSASAQIAYGESAMDSAQSQIDSGKDTLKSSEEQLQDAWDQYYDAREEALENANLDQLLNMDTISQLITAQNFSMPAGYIYQGDDQYLLKVGDAFVDIDDLNNALLTNISGIGDIRLCDVADVTVIDNAGDSYAKVNGNNAVVLSIFKGSTSGTSEVSKNCNKAIEELEEKYPGLRITPLMDQGDYIALIVDSVLSNLVKGALLAVIVLLLFLKDFRPTLVVAFSIPLSVMFAIVLMYFSGINLNIISLSGLALGIGMLVDNSIVVIENIYRLRSRGVPAAKAAVQGANQVCGAIVASTITTVCVFLPLVFSSGLTRDLLKDMGLTIGYSLLASLIVALTVVPATSSTMLKKCEEKQHPWFDKATAAYARVLRYCLRVKVVPLALAILLLGFSVAETAIMGMELIPDMSFNQFEVALTMPDGTEKNKAFEIADRAMAEVTEVEGVDVVGAMADSTANGIVSSALASSESDFSSFTFYIMLNDDGSAHPERVQDDIRDATKDLECEVTVSSASSDITSMMETGMQVDIYGSDLETLLGISEDVMGMLEEIDGLENISNGQEKGDSEIRVTIDKDAAMRCGLTVAQIYSELANAINTSTTSTSLTVGDEDYQVEIVDKTGELTVDNLMSHEFETEKANEDGEMEKHTYQLRDFATQTDGVGVASISRENQSRMMTVTADTMDGYNTTLLSRQLNEKLEQYELPEGYSIEIGGETSTVSDMMTQMVKMISLALVFIYLVMVAQFQSLLSPFIVIFTIPLAFTGGLIGLLVSGEILSLMSMMGFLLLAGVVVNNGIVFVDYTNQLRLAGMEKREALVATGVTRMRPILMTALTTILSMCTMVVDSDAGSQMGRGMAIVVIGGLLYATLMTLFIVPVMYDLLFRKKELKEIDVGDDLDEALDEATEYAMQRAESETEENEESTPEIT